MAQCRLQDWSWAQDLRSQERRPLLEFRCLQTTIEGTKFAVGTASSAGRTANDSSGGIRGGFDQDAQGSEDSADIPAPPPLTPPR
jgi:hypothetical protein